MVSALPSARDLLFACCLMASSVAAAVQAADWPQFRGPSGNATCQQGQVPTEWNSTKNIVWKTALPGRGASSPIVFGDRVFLTAYTGYGLADEAQAGKEEGSKDELRLHVLSFDRQSGKQLWDESIPGSPDTQDITNRVADHGYATGTPVTDGKAVYAYFGVSGVVAYDYQGKLLWQARLGSNTAGFGSASSPVIFENLVIVNASIESDNLVALDKATGQEVWKVDSVNRSWSTPCIAEVPGGDPELIINHQEIIRGINPRTGEELWNCRGIQDYVVPVPIAHEGIVYCLGGRSNRAIAVKLGGRGDVTKTHKLWEVTIGANVTSPVLYDGHLYWASDKAIANCLVAKTGEEVYRQRLPTRARIYASIVRAGEHFFVTTRDQGVVVLAAKPEYEEVARNVIETDEGQVNASPAVCDGRIYLRTDGFLYCIGTTSAGASQ